MPNSAIAVAGQVVLALWSVGGSWDDSAGDTAGAVALWLREQITDGDAHAHLELIGALMDVAAGLAPSSNATRRGRPWRRCAGP